MRTWIGIILLFITTALHAMPGVYIGGLLGYGVVNFTPNVSFSDPDVGVSASSTNKYSPEAFAGAPIVGYAWGVQRFRFAVEGQAFWAPISMNNVDETGAHTTLTFEEEYVLLFRPGYQLFQRTPLVLYLNVGIAWAKIRGDADDPEVTQAFNFGEKHTWGYKAGAGFGYDITRHWTVRMDYIFSQYETITHTASQDLGGGFMTPVDLDLPTTQSQYLLGMTFQW